MKKNTYLYISLAVAVTSAVILVYMMTKKKAAKDAQNYNTGELDPEPSGGITEEQRARAELNYTQTVAQQIGIKPQYSKT